MAITASNPIASVSKDISTSSAAAAQAPSGHEATANAQEKAPAPVQLPTDIKG